MARIQGNSEAGKLGNKIYYTWHGRQCERSMPTHMVNPRTEAQQAHRSNFTQISKLSSYMKETHLVGLHGQAVREKNSTYALFKRINKDCFTPDGEIDYPRIVVSKGSVRKASITSVTVADGLLTVIFDGYVYGGAATDMFFLFVYSHALCAGFLADPVPRSNGQITVDLPDEWHDQTLHLYAFLQGYRLRTSDTIYRMLQ